MVGSAIGFIGIILYLAIAGFILYFLLKVLSFMAEKNRNDKLLLQKLDELSKNLDKDDYLT